MSGNGPPLNMSCTLDLDQSFRNTRISGQLIKKSYVEDHLQLLDHKLEIVTEIISNRMKEFLFQDLDA